MRAVSVIVLLFGIGLSPRESLSYQAVDLHAPSLTSDDCQSRDRNNNLAWQILNECDGLPSSRVTAAYETELGLVIGTDQGVLVGNTIYNIQSGLPSNEITALGGSIRFDERTASYVYDLYIGTSEGLGVLRSRCIDPATDEDGQTACNDYEEPQLDVHLLHRAVTVIKHDSVQTYDSWFGYRGSPGRAWIGTDTGLWAMHPIGGLHHYGFGGHVTDIVFDESQDLMYVARRDEGVEEWRFRWSGSWNEDYYDFFLEATYGDPNIHLCLENAVGLTFDSAGYLEVAYTDYGQRKCFQPLGPSKSSHRRRILATYDGNTWSAQPIQPRLASKNDAPETDELGSNLIGMTRWGSTLWLGAQPSDDGIGGLARSYGELSWVMGEWQTVQQANSPLPTNEILFLASGDDAVYVGTPVGLVIHRPLSGQPRLVHPLNNSLVTTNLTLAWEGALNAQSHDVVVSRSVSPHWAFTDIIYDRQAIPGDSVVLDIDLEPGQMYYMRVRSRSGDETTLWTTVTMVKASDLHFDQLTAAEVLALHAEPDTGVIWESWQRNDTHGLRVHRAERRAGNVESQSYDLEESLTSEALPITKILGAGPNRAWAIRFDSDGDTEAARNSATFGLIDHASGRRWTPQSMIEDGHKVDSVGPSASIGDTLWAVVLLRPSGSPTGQDVTQALVRFTLDDETAELIHVRLDQNLPRTDPIGALLVINQSLWISTPDAVFEVPLANDQGAWIEHPVPAGGPIAAYPDGDILVSSNESNTRTISKLSVDRDWVTIWSSTEQAAEVHSIIVESDRAFVASGSGVWSTLLPLSSTSHWWRSFTYLRSLSSDGTGRVWGRGDGTENAGVFLYDTGVWYRIQDAAFLPSRQTKALVVDRTTNSTWIGTDAGLVLAYQYSAPDVSASVERPQSFSLQTPFPNPSDGRVTVMLDIPMPADTRLVLYDLLGRRVAMLLDEYLPAGPKQITIAERLPSGLYLLRLQSGALSATQRMTVVR